MEKLLTTKELAHAIGASESSMRRWTDSGAIRTSRTVGGHRRIPLSEAIRFVRDTHATLVRPDILGLGPIAGPAAGGAGGRQRPAEDELFDALNAGDAARARATILGLYLGGSSLAAIFDGALGGAMRRVGELWQHGPAGILVEHRATDICIACVNQIRHLLPPAGNDAPLAIGGAPAGDPYMLPSLMAAAVFADAGYRETNYGANTPVELLADDAERRGAAVVWLSMSTPGGSGGREQDELRRNVEDLARRLAGRGVQLVLGGRHAGPLLPLESPNARLLESMSELAAFARTITPARPADAPPAAANGD